MVSLDHNLTINLIKHLIIVSLMGLFRDNKKLFQTEHNMVKNPNLEEVNQLAMLRAWPRI